MPRFIDAHDGSMVWIGRENNHFYEKQKLLNAFWINVYKPDAPQSPQISIWARDLMRDIFIYFFSTQNTETIPKGHKKNLFDFTSPSQISFWLQSLNWSVWINWIKIKSQQIEYFHKTISNKMIVDQILNKHYGQILNKFIRLQSVYARMMNPIYDMPKYGEHIRKIKDTHKIEQKKNFWRIKRKNEMNFVCTLCCSLLLLLLFLLLFLVFYF